MKNGGGDDFKMDQGTSDLIGRNIVESDSKSMQFFILENDLN
jgi:hypothetical protein